MKTDSKAKPSEAAPTKIERFNLEIDPWEKGAAWMEKRPDGEWVRFYDMMAALAESSPSSADMLERLAEVVEEADVLVSRHMAAYNELLAKSDRTIKEERQLGFHSGMVAVNSLFMGRFSKLSADTKSKAKEEGAK